MDERMERRQPKQTNNRASQQQPSLLLFSTQTKQQSMKTNKPPPQQPPPSHPIPFQMLSLKLLLILIIIPKHTTATQPAVTPILLNCGSTTRGTDDVGRQWLPDSTYLGLVGGGGGGGGDSISAMAKNQDSSLPSPVPYMSARIFSTQTNYILPLNNSTNPHFLRLHFYPSTTYSSFNPSHSFLSATTSSGASLLHNFSASITAHALTLAYIIKEFSLPPSPHLTLSLKPASSYPAFINGIELIPIHENQIFDEPATMVGLTESSSTINSWEYSLETMFRLNVGGGYISPLNDSSHLTRTWFSDSPYLHGAGKGVASRAPSRVKLSSKEGRAVAPEEVYTTVRTMGDDPKVNINYNLTWVMPVDANFTYLIRLHFCEYRLSRVNQRVFDIFINNRTAALQADVVLWSGGTGVPIHKDYTIFVGGGDQLWVALHPSDASGSQYEDALLNGMEVFKLNDSFGNLAGPNPVPSKLLPVKEMEEEKMSVVKEKKSMTPVTIVAIVVGSVAVLVLVLLIFFKKKKKKRMRMGGERSESNTTSSWLPVYYGKNNSGSSNISTEAACGCRYFTLGEIKRATKNFKESEVIGVGGFGKVYRGVIDGGGGGGGGGREVAIKRANPSSQQGVKEFQTEIEMLSKLRHKHLVSLIGYSEEGEEMILVYDYMERGTLRNHLRKNNPPWKQRLEICIGVAKGLHYLHTGAKSTIIHRDVKSTNILLNHEWVAKVSDFGLSKTGAGEEEEEEGGGVGSTKVKGSFGYVDPEYYMRRQLSEKSDVYSFGVVMLEVVSGREVVKQSVAKEEVNLAEWGLRCMGKGEVEELVDIRIRGSVREECLESFLDTASKCLSDHGVERPSMAHVLWKLELALQLQEEDLVSGGRKDGLLQYQLPIEEQQQQHFHSGKEEDDDIFSKIVGR